MKIKNNGTFLEELIANAIEIYNETRVGFFQKRNINNFFLNKYLNYKDNLKNYSGCDFIGIYQGKHIVIEAKEVKGEKFNINNISNNQKHELTIVNELGGLGLLIIYFYLKEKIYILKYSELLKLNKNIIHINEIKKVSYEIKWNKSYYLDFILYIKNFV